ncbi:hypothetical protein V6N12_044144 [Hibiscus sabdariffa]|uniref:Uncharacterized protein n=1 Tax=Hibiscus sabdariffa TaxID=183260 RepID=A0ABR2DGD8_9ROSI
MVETRSQSVTSAAMNISTTEAPLSLTELNREVTQIQTTVARLEASFDERFQMMQEKRVGEKDSHGVGVRKSGEWCFGCSFWIAD